MTREKRNNRKGRRRPGQWLPLLIAACALFVREASAVPSQYKAMEEYKRSENAPVSGTEKIERKKVQYAAKKYPDPFKDPTALTKGAGPGKTREGERPLPPLQVAGITWGGIFPMAIINGRVLREGDTIQGAKIIKIAEDGIIVLFDSRQHTLSAPSAAYRQQKKQKE